jgi:hypothetical protein
VTTPLRAQRERRGWTKTQLDARRRAAAKRRGAGRQALDVGTYAYAEAVVRIDLLVRGERERPKPTYAARECWSAAPGRSGRSAG